MPAIDLPAYAVLDPNDQQIGSARAARKLVLRAAERLREARETVSDRKALMLGRRAAARVHQSVRCGAPHTGVKLPARMSVTRSSVVPTGFGQALRDRAWREIPRAQAPEASPAVWPVGNSRLAPVPGLEVGLQANSVHWSPVEPTAASTGEHTFAARTPQRAGTSLEALESVATGFRSSRR